MENSLVNFSCRHKNDSTIDSYYIIRYVFNYIAGVVFNVMFYISFSKKKKSKDYLTTSNDEIL